MAATAGGGGGGGPCFSIRGYAARARAGAADEGGRCWPLGGPPEPLPPMEVRRFRWWADEAALADDMDEGEEERRNAAMRRKRSVVELFAAVPRVAGDDGRKVKRKLDKGKQPAGAQAKKGPKKDKAPAEIAARKKEKGENANANSLSISQLFQDAIQKRKLKKSPSKKRKNQEVSVLPNKKNINGSKKSVLSNQKAMENGCEVQTILKKHLGTGEGTFLKNSDVTCPSKSSLKSKHVTFSDTADICGLTASQTEDNTEQSQVVQASQQPSQRDNSQVVNDQLNTEEPELVHQRIDALSGTIEQDSSSLSEKVGSTGASHTVPLTKPVYLNHCIEISKRDNGNRLSSMSSAALPSPGLAQKSAGVNFRLQEGPCLGIGRQAEENCQMMPRGPSVPAGLAVDKRPEYLMRTPLPHPYSSGYAASLKEALDRNRSTILQERLIANCHLTEVHPSVLRSGNDVVSNINTSTGSNKSTNAQPTVCVSACRNMYSDGYMGLPINSHGEFVRVHTGGTLNPDELLKTQCLGKDSLHPSTPPTFFTPNTSLDYAHLRINHEAPPFFTVANFGIQPDPRLIPTMPTALSMGFRQHPSSERVEAHNHAIPSSIYSCRNQQGSSEQCLGARFLGHDDQLLKSLEMQSCFPRQNYKQNIQPAAETTMRLMGKTVSLGTGIGGLENCGPCSSNQIRAEDRCFLGMYTQVSPQLFHEGLVDPAATFRILNGGRPPSEYASRFSSVPAAEQGPGFSKSNQSRQHQLAVPNKVSMQPVSRYNEVRLGHQQPAVANQVQSTANHLQPGPAHCGRTASVATKPSYDPWNKFKNIAETRPGPSQFSLFPENSSSMTQMTPISNCMSGYSVQSTAASSTTQTKFTSLRPLPPSMVSSHVFSSEAARPHGSTAPRPLVPLPREPGKSNAPGGVIFEDKGSMKQATVVVSRSSLESSKQINKSFKGPAEKDDVLLTSPKKPCIAVRKDLNPPPLLVEIYGSRPGGQPRDMPVRLNGGQPRDMPVRLNGGQPRDMPVRLNSGQPRDMPVRLSGPETILRAVTSGANTRSALTDSSSTVGTRPVKLQSGAKHILQPCASASLDQVDSWPVRSVIQLEVENDARAVGASKKTDLC
ncbi:uncharacterized protein [Triticum aestivum]|uniref:uncharacterized protein isoform X1 n=1 Tax=Triticum aestivum TaxID=4565 RepID=UPI001D005F99|nr:uncharacterized protein LOC123063355 isoform X1 [Triticum aestivum]